MTARIHPTALIEDAVEIGEATAIWDHVHIRRGARIGAHCIVGEKTYIAYDVNVGDLCKLNNHVSICTGVTIESGCFIAAHVVFTNDVTPRATDPDIKALLDSGPGAATLTTTVRRGTSIGANATIGPGIELGEFCMVGMGAVVTRDVPAHALVIGNPARIRGLVDRAGHIVWRAPSDRMGLPADGTRIACADGSMLVVESQQVVRVDGSGAI